METRDMLYYYLGTALMGLVLCHLYVQWSRMGRMVNKLPGPTALPIIGNLLALHVGMVELNDKLRLWGKMYYPVFRLWIGPTALIHTRHPDDLEILLTSPKQVNKRFGYEHFHPWLKTGLLTSNRQKWYQRRKILTPAFHFNTLKKYIDITNEEGEKAVANVRTEPKETKQNLVPFCSKYTLNIICESAMGVALDREDDNGTALKYKDAVYKMGNFIMYRMIRPYIQDWMLRFMPKLNNEVKEIVYNLDNFTDTIIKERREYHESTDFKHLNRLEEEDNIYTGKSKRLAMLDLLLAAEKYGLIDDEGIKEEVATFVFEGHDTTAMGMCFSIMLLAENQDAQDQAREEVESILGPKNGLLEVTDLQEMNYLERCIKESLRLFPSVGSVARHITEDIQLKHCKAPAGAEVIVHFIDLHRDPEFWPNPEKFDPDRFLPEEIRKRHPFAYLPFSAGPRNCIGQKFAMMELKSLLARILYNFYLEPIDYTCDIKIISDIVIRPSQPVHTKFVRIDR